LDSLVRIETYQWVRRDKLRKNLSGRFCPLAFETPEEGHREELCGSSEVFIEQA
jgi:hypothetical protein